MVRVELLGHSFRLNPESGKSQVPGRGQQKWKASAEMRWDRESQEPTLERQAECRGGLTARQDTDILSFG